MKDLLKEYVSDFAGDLTEEEQEQLVNQLQDTFNKGVAEIKKERLQFK